jgi:hypothetical protein
MAGGRPKSDEFDYVIEQLVIQRKSLRYIRDYIENQCAKTGAEPVSLTTIQRRVVFYKDKWKNLIHVDEDTPLDSNWDAYVRQDFMANGGANGF